MVSRIYSEAELQAKKYGELLKIAKNIGAPSSSDIGRRLKTTNLIEGILEAQSATCILESAAVVVDALDESIRKEEGENDHPTQEVKPKELEKRTSSKEEELLSDIPFPTEEEELLSDIQFPQEIEDKETSNIQNQLKKEDNNGTSIRQRTGTFEVEETSDRSSVGGKTLRSGKRRRTRTFEVIEDSSEHPVVDKPKRRRTSTYEVNDEEVQDKVEENSQQLEALTKRISDEKQQRENEDSPSVSVVQADAKRRSSRSRSFVIDKTQEETSLKANEDNVAQKTPKTPAHKTPKMQRSAERKSFHNSANQSACSVRKSVTASSKFSIGTPGSKKKDPTKIMKPLFTVGKGNSTTKEGKEGAKPIGSSIPRFVSFARKLKVPNFAKIHERAFNRMEALDDYMDKKKKMSEVTNSGTKKQRPRPASGEIFKPAVMCVENLNLNFTAANSPAKPVRTSISKSPRVALKESPSDAGSKSTKKLPLKPKAAVKPANSRIKSPKAFTRKSPRTGNQNAKPTSVAGSARKSPSVSKLSPKARYSTLPRPLKENQKPGCASVANPTPHKLDSTINPTKTPASTHKRQEYNPKATVNKPLNYVPYKGTLKPLNTAAIRKTMSEKLPNIKSSKERRDNQKSFLKGVRFNKRFELQMAKRGINITQQ